MGWISGSKRVKYIAGIAVVALLGVFVFMIGSNLAIILGVKPHIVETANEVPSAQVAIILGAKVFDTGTISDVLVDRLDTGIDLYGQGKVKKLLLTGDHGRVIYDEVNTMRKYALSKGVPAKDIFMDHAGFDTYDSMYRARDVFDVKNAIVVTQEFHLSRSVYTARALGIDAIGVPADRHIYIKALNFEVRETLARAKAFIELRVTHPKPRFLGPKIPITGDGRLTNDYKD